MPTLTSPTPPPVEPVNYAFYQRLMIGLGALVPLLVAVLYSFPGAFQIPGVRVSFLPPVIAVINSLTALVLLLGYIFIRQKNVAAHRAMMGTAFGLGGLFLLAYVAYHSQAPQTKFGGVGLIRMVYYTLLLSHILLAIVTVGLVLFTLYFALTQQFARHRRIARWTFPIWLYVSVTGVIVYFLIAPYYAAT
jgi:putative membrane protein